MTDINIQKIDIISKLKNTDSIITNILDKIASRAEIGLKKYKTNMDRTDLDIIEWITHFQEELMDALIYTEKIKLTMKEEKPDEKPKKYNKNTSKPH